jgi:hypothetical protein
LCDLDLAAVSKLKISFDGPGSAAPGMMLFPKITVFLGLSWASPHSAECGVDCSMPATLAGLVIAHNYRHAFRELKRLLRERPKRVDTDAPDPH